MLFHFINSFFYSNFIKINVQVCYNYNYNYNFNFFKFEKSKCLTTVEKKRFKIYKFIPVLHTL